MSTPNTTEYRQLGKAGLRVSVPIVGAMSFGKKCWMDWVTEEEESIAVLKAAWDKGINTIDTANVYSNGASEEIVAKFMEKYSIPRERLIIASKCFFLSAPDQPDKVTIQNPQMLDERDYINQAGLSRAAIFNQVDASLKRLKTSYIDLLQIHRFDPKTPVEETMKALHTLVESNKVRYIGASAMKTWQFAMMNEVADKNGWTKFVSMQDRHSLLYREEEREMHSYCKFNGIGIIPYSPLHRGFLVRPIETETARSKVFKGTFLDVELQDHEKEIVHRVAEVATKKGWTKSRAVLEWSKTKTTSPIVGLGSIKRLEEALLPKGEEGLTDDEMMYLEELYKPVKSDV